jgi:hypothetical protein
MKQAFPYARFGAWYRPVIPVTLRFKKKELRYLALLDSGADFNIFHSDIAGLLGIDVTKAKKTTPFKGIGSDSESRAAVFDIDLGIEGTFFTSMVLFSDAIGDSSYGVLGQQGFFNHFDITFRYNLGQIELDEQRIEIPTS